MLEDGIKAENLEARIQVKDIGEIVSALLEAK
jgi:hypothetical protein